MVEKLKPILGSVRFWIVTLTALTATLELFVVPTGFQLEAFFDIVQMWLGAVVGIGTLDSVAEKFGSKAKTVDNG